MNTVQPFEPTTAPLVEYASTLHFDPAVVNVAKGMLGLAILSGLCVAVCFAAFMGPWGAALHLCVFAVTIWIAIRTNARATPITPKSGLRLALDLLALAGLCILALLPVGYWAFLNARPNQEMENIGAIAVLIPFVLLGASTLRHWLLYREISVFCRGHNLRGLRASFLGLGAVKMVYEGLWLICCALVPMLLLLNKSGWNDADDVAIYLAFGAFIGCIGFTIVWVWMIVNHACLLRVVARRVSGSFRI